MMRTQRALIVRLLLIGLLGLSATGCGKKKKADKPQVTQTPATPATGTGEDFETVEGAPGTRVIATGDLPLGEETPDLERFGGPGGMELEREDYSHLPAGAAEAFRDVLFAFDSYELTREGREILAGVGAYLAANPTVAILIEGHCDEHGTAAYNLALGEKRALAVREYLASMRIAPSRMTTVSYGEERPADPRSVEAAWARNRRAHFRGTVR